MNTRKSRRVLTDDQARQVLIMRAQKKTLREIAQHFNVSMGCIQGIVYGYTYQEIEVKDAQGNCHIPVRDR